MLFYYRLRTLLVLFSIVMFGGCAAPLRPNTDIDRLLRMVSYDTTVSPAPPVSTVPPSPPVFSKPSVAEQARTAGESVMDGLRTTVGFMFLGIFKIVESALDDDEADDCSTSRGKADRNLNQWLGDREQWRSDG